MSSRLPSARLILVAGALVLGLSACGRRGALEAPPDPTAPNAGASDSGFTDFGVAFDCTRGNNAPQGQAAMLDEN